MGWSKLLPRILLAGCLLPTAFCILTFAQGGTGKLPPRRNPPPRFPPIQNNPPPRAPDLKISERRVREIVVLDLNGKISSREGGPLLRNAIRRLVKDGKKKVLLNLAKVSSIDPSQVEEMVSTYSSVEKDGGQLKLCNPTTKVRDQLIKASGSGVTPGPVDLMSDTFETEQEALASFR